MKFSKSSQLFLVSSIGLFVATLLMGCALTTIDLVFVTSASGSGTSSDGAIYTLAVDSRSGALRPVAATVSSGGVNPVSMATTPDYANLYVANQGDGSIVHFAIGLNGALTKKDAESSLSPAPVAITVNNAGTYLYAILGPSGKAVLQPFPLKSDGTLGPPTAPANGVVLSVPGYPNDVIIPTGVTVLADNGTVYVAAYDQSAYNPGGSTPSTANPGWVFGFTVGSDGSLTAAKNSPYEAGVKPSALAADPTNRFLYVTDYASNELIGYTILDGSTLNFLSNGPFKTGNDPSAIVIDPRGKFIYVTNALDSTVSGYAITLATGTPTVAIGAGGTQGDVTDTDPVAIAVDPALGRFVYTANYLGNSVSGFRLDPTAGSVSPNQASPYPISGSGPTALVIVPHGNHATQSVTP